MWNGEEITGINGYLFYSQKIFCARRAFPEGSKRMYCFDFAATVLFLHSDFRLQLTFIWAESCSWQHLSPCVCGYSKSRVIQELNYHVCFPLLCLWTELRSGRRKIPRRKNEYASTSQLRWLYLQKHSNSSNQRLPFIFKLERIWRCTYFWNLPRHIPGRALLLEEDVKWVALFQPQMGCTVPTSGSWKNQLQSCLCKSFGNNKKAHLHFWFLAYFQITALLDKNVIIIM